MAKQLSTAGFSVVVLEQGGWGKFGRDWEYTKDELVNGNPAPADRLMSDPSRQRNTFRRTDKEKAAAGTHAYGCVVGGGTVTYGGCSWRHLPWEFNEATTSARSRARASRIGRSTTKSSSPITPRRNGKWASRACASIRRSWRRCRRTIPCRPCRSRPRARCSRWPRRSSGSRWFRARSRSSRSRTWAARAA